MRTTTNKIEAEKLFGLVRQLTEQNTMAHSVTLAMLDGTELEGRIRGNRLENRNPSGTGFEWAGEITLETNHTTTRVDTTTVDLMDVDRITLRMT